MSRNTRRGRGNQLKLHRKVLIPKPEGMEDEPVGAATNNDDRPRRPQAPRRS